VAPGRRGGIERCPTPIRLVKQQIALVSASRWPFYGIDESDRAERATAVRRGCHTTHTSSRLVTASGTDAVAGCVGVIGNCRVCCFPHVCPVVGLLVAGLDEQWEAPSREYITVLPAVATALLLLGLSGNLLTLLFAWTLLDLLALLVLGFPGRSNWVLMAGILQGGGLFLVMVAALRTWTSSATLAFFAVSTDSITLYLLLAAFAAGGFWWLVFGTPDTLLYTRLVSLLLGIGLVASGVLFWRARRPSLRAAALTTWLGEMLVLAFLFDTPALAQALLWNGVLAVSVVAFHGGRRTWREPSSLALAIALLSLSGLPGGALGESGRLLATLITTGHDWLTTALVVSMSTLFAGMLTLARTMQPSSAEENVATSKTEAEPPSPSLDRMWLGLGILALASWPFVGRLMGIAPNEMATEAFPWGVHIAGVGLAWLAALLFVRLEMSVVGLTAWLNALAATLSARWLWQGVGALVVLLMRGIRGLLRVLEGENYGWLLLFLVIILILLS